MYKKIEVCPNCRELFRFMKFVTFFLMLGISASYAADSYSQSTFLSLEAKDKTIREVFSEIEQKTEFIFFYYDGVLDTNRKVSINIRNKAINVILDELFASTDNKYMISGRQVFISKKEHSQSQSGKIRVTGTVTDKKGETLIGVTVMAKGTTIGAVTNFDGMYIIDVPDSAVLVFSYVGFTKQEAPVLGRNILNVVLEESEMAIEEVVVVGYGSQKRESIVGAITSIQPEKLQGGTTRSMSNNLAGLVSGIVGVQRSGEPGYDNSNFWIRGISTFAGSRSPLVLVDGIERSLDNIDPQEIESFSVLKDASASAVYGVRGANGVVLINTKRGKIGKPTVSVRSEYAVTAPTKLPNYIGAADYMQLLDDIRMDNNGKPMYTDRINNTRNLTDPELYPDVNWIDEITKDYASNYRATIDVSGGTEKLRYAFVAAYYNENGIIERDKNYDWDPSIKLNRYNVRSNVDLDITPTTLLRFNIGGYLQDRNAPPQSIDELFDQAFTNPPFVHPSRYSSGQIPRVVERTNPWALATQQGYQRNSGSKIESLFSIEQDLKKLLPGLKLKGVFSFDRYSSNSVNRKKEPDYYNPATGRDDDGELILSIASYGQEYLGYEKASDWGDKSVYIEGNVSYNQTFGKHAIDAMFLYNQRNYDNGDKLPFRYQGIAGRLSYTYDSKYIAEFNFGYNGSENFDSGKRFGFFPSAAIGWYISEESFMQPVINTISKLKVRASYGLVGNDRLDGRRFAYITTIGDTGGYKWGYNIEMNRAGRWEGEFGVPDLTWETVAKANIGLEFGFWKNAIELNIDCFEENRRDIFMKRTSIPSSAGFINPPWDNYGKVKNRGIDISLQANKPITQDLFVSVLGTFTYAVNEVIEKDEPYSVIGTNRARTGKPVDQLFGLVAEGLFTESDFSDVAQGILAEGIPDHTYDKVRPGDIKYADLNNDGLISELDKTAIGGTWDPQIIYGFGINIRYKIFDLGALFQGNAKTYSIIGRNSYFLPGSGNGALGNYFNNIDDRWTVDNPAQDVFYPRAKMGSSPNNNQESTWWLRDMSMLRLRNLEIGVNFPGLSKKIKINGARIFARGTNLLTFSGFKLWDPELNTTSGARYPLMKSVSLGLEINF